MSEATPLLEIQGVTKRFGPDTAVEDVSLSLSENEFFALLGPSGCGKTTLLRLLAGFEVADAGRVLLDGQDLTAVRPNRRPINMMFQSYALFPHLTVRRNIAYGLRMDGIRDPDLSARVDEALELVQMTALAERRPDQLSGGQGQRVALARALIKRPRLLLLDEPLAALDRKLRQQMQFELKKLQHDVGITFIVVTHDQEEALAMADRIALLNQGRIAQLGSAEELYEEPRNHFVADFIGTMNFFEGRIADGGVEVAELGLLKGNVGGAAAGTPAFLAVRPERITLHDTPPAAGEPNLVPGILEGSSYMGQDLSLFVRVSGQETPLVLRMDSADGRGLQAAEGAQVWCSWPMAASRVLTQ
ncbi:MAG: ABC transporter ATP-binding protein [Planctomycetota bacterium]|jgi:spermidine/putrescine ABC transporter ATP-binding subunit